MTVSIRQLTPAFIVGHLRRWLRARRLGIPFHRRGAFRIPRQLTIGARVVDLKVNNDTGSRNDFIGIFLDNMYMIEDLKTAESVVDIGANQGFFSIYARSLFPHAKIHAYEPNPDLAPHLMQNCRPLGIEVFMEGVAAKGGAAEMQSMGDSNQGRIALTGDGTGIRVTSIADVVERIGGSVDVLKLDCEGFEWDILSDGDSLRRVRTLTMEYHNWANNSTHADVRPLLEQLGFEVMRQERSTNFGQVLARRAPHAVGAPPSAPRG